MSRSLPLFVFTFFFFFFFFFYQCSSPPLSSSHRRRHHHFAEPCSEPVASLLHKAFEGGHSVFDSLGKQGGRNMASTTPREGPTGDTHRSQKSEHTKKGVYLFVRSSLCRRQKICRQFAVFCLVHVTKCSFLN